MALAAIQRAHERLLEGLAGLAALIVAAMLAGVTADVLLRNLFVAGIRGIVELTEIGLYLSAILAAPWLLHRGQHIKADLLSQFGPPAWVRKADLLSDLLGFAACATVAWYGFLSALESFRIDSMIRKTIELPEWLLIAPLSAVMALVAAEFLLRLGSAVSGSAASGRGPESAPRPLG